MPNNDIEKNTSLVNLTNEEVKEYLEKIKNGDQKAFEELMKKNKKLIFKIANNLKGIYRNRLSLEDIISLCEIGFWKATQKYKEINDAKFMTYAIKLMKIEVRNAHLKDTHAIKKKNYYLENISKINFFEKEFRLKNGRNPDDHELAQLTGFSLKKVNTLLSERITFHRENTEKGKFHKSREQHLNPVALSGSKIKRNEKLINKINEFLETRDALIIIKKLGLDTGKPMSFEEIAKLLDSSVTTISRHFNKSCQKLGNEKEFIKNLQNSNLKTR